jgi:hypothetical protein
MLLLADVHTILILLKYTSSSPVAHSALILHALQLSLLKPNARVTFTALTSALTSVIVELLILLPQVAIVALLLLLLLSLLLLLLLLSLLLLPLL